MKKIISIIAALVLLSNLSTLKADTIAEYRTLVWGETANPDLQWGQTFTPDASGTLDTITVYGRDFGNPPDEITFYLYDVINSSTLALLATSTILTPSLPSSTYAAISASFLSSSMVLAQGHQYAFSLFYDSPFGEQVDYEVSNPGYGGGQLFIQNGLNYSPHGTNTSLSFSVTAAVPDSINTAAMIGGLSMVMAWWQRRQRRSALVAGRK